MSAMKLQTHTLLSFQPPPEVTVSKIYLSDRSKISQSNTIHCNSFHRSNKSRHCLHKDTSVESCQSNNTTNLYPCQTKLKSSKQKKKNKKKKKINDSTENLLKDTSGRSLGAQVQPLMSILMSPRKQYSAFHNCEENSKIEEEDQTKIKHHIQIKLIELPASVEPYQTKTMSKTVSGAWFRNKPLRSRKIHNNQPFFLACSRVSLSPRLQTCT